MVEVTKWGNAYQTQTIASILSRLDDLEAAVQGGHLSASAAASLNMHLALTAGASVSTGPPVPTMPAANGTRLIAEDFSVDAALGSFVEVYGARGWSFYDGDGSAADHDTSGWGRYSTYGVDRTFSVSNRLLTVNQHIDTDGMGLGGVITQYINLTQGSRFGLSIKVNVTGGDGSGFKVVPCMGWPSSNTWDSEIDFGEVNDYRQDMKCKLFSGPDGNNGAYWYGPDDTGIFLASNTWHEIFWDWQDTLIGNIDGNEFDMGHVPLEAMRPLVQFETWIGDGPVPAGASAEAQISYIYADQA